MNKASPPVQEGVEVIPPVTRIKEIKNMRGRPRKVVASSDSQEDDEDFQLTLSYRTIIAANTKRLREQMGLRQLDLAKLMGTGQGQVASLEMARISIGLHSLTRLATALNVEAPSLLLPFLGADKSSSGNAESGDARPVDSENKGSPAPDLLAGNLAVGVNLTTVKGIVAATHKRLEDLERRHGSVPMTREMLTSVLVTVLNASQNMDSGE